MQPLKSIFGVIGAAVPVIYCGGLLYYFIGNSGSVENAESIGLGPTLLGLGAVGALFCIPLLVKIVRLFIGTGSSGSGGRRGPGASTHDGDGAFDADAAVARYMARRPEEAAPDAPAAPRAPQGGAPATPSGFGRRIR